MIDILFPKICLLCDNSLEKTIICRSCSESFSFIDNKCVCDVCGVPYSSFSGQKLHLCGNCISSTESLLKIRSVLLYKDKLRDLLHDFKYSSKLYIADFLSDLIIDRFPLDPYLENFLGKHIFFPLLPACKTDLCFLWKVSTEGE